MKCLPNFIVITVLKKLMFFVGIILGVRKAVVMQQLSLCFPEKSSIEIYRLTKKIYSELAITVVEVFTLPSKYLMKRIQIIGYDNIQKARNMGKGVIIVTGHFGNWELIPQLVAREHSPVSGPAAKIKNPFINRYIENKRAHFNLVAFKIKNAFLYITKALKKNEVVTLVIDQRARKHGIESEFFGQKAYLHSSAAQLAIRFEVPIVYAYDVRDAKGYHKVYFHEPVVYKNLEYTKENIYKITVETHSVLEKYIKEYPHLWFWVHRKWKI
jgi:KDO2-lipid IV(A) lauroyltransferase